MAAFKLPDERFVSVDKVSVAGTQWYFNEFLYQRLIFTANEALPEGAKITTSRARGLRAVTEELMMKDPGNKDPKSGVSKGQFSNCVSPELIVKSTIEAMSSDPKLAPARDALQTMLKDPAQLKTLKARFKGCLGLLPEAKTIRSLPLSPYDPRFANRKVFMDNGSSLLYVLGGSLQWRLDFLQDEHPDGDYKQLTLANMDEVLADPEMDLYKVVDKETVKAGKMYTEDDSCGVSALRSLMSDADYQRIHRRYNGKPWCSAAVDAAGKPLYMSQETIGRVRDIVTALRFSGYQFDFEPDRRPGQVKLHFENGMDLRVIDPYNETYAGGRIYQNGVSIRYQIPTSAMPAAERTGQAQWMDVAPSTVEDAVRLVQYACGEPIHRTGPGLEPTRLVGEATLTPDAKGKPRYDTYHSSKNFRAKVGPWPGNPAYNLSIYFSSNQSPAFTVFKDKASAEEYLRDAVASARDRFQAEVDVETLIGLAAEHKDDPDFTPTFSNNPEIVAIQHRYWDVLRDTDNELVLLKPGVEVDDYSEAAASAQGADLEAMVYHQDTPEARVRAHMQDLTDDMIGQYQPDASGKRFNAVNVGIYMDSPYGRFRNNDDLVSAMRAAELTPEELKGDDFYNAVMADRLIRYNPDKAIVMARSASPFVRDMYATIREALIANGCKVEENDIMMDDNGIVHYSVDRINRATPDKSGSASERVEGEIGQILAPDDKGMVETKDYFFVPGYEAYIRPNQPGEDLPYEERMVLSDYSDVLKRGIRTTIRNDMMAAAGRESVGVPTSLNNVFRHLYETRYPKDFYERTAADGMSPELRDAIIKTNKARVRLSSSIMDEANRAAIHLAQGRMMADPLNDNKMDALTLTGGRNVAILEQPGDGMFDPHLTGNGGSQGVRYLVEGAQVKDGHIIPRADRQGHCALTQYCIDSGRMPEFDAVDRANMTMNGLLHGLRETDPVGVAQVSCGMWTLEDGIVVSKEFADAHKVRDVNGQFRPLMAGDKMECHGNKGVISIVVDPNADEAYLEAKGLIPLAEMFTDNPDLQVIMSPYSAVSRFNAGLGREAMASHPKDLEIGNEVYPGSIGFVKMTILEQTADSKTHFSDDGTQKRSYGAQMGWALASNDCTAVMAEAFRDNHKAVSNLREMLITMGMDMDPTGRLQIGYHPHEGEERRVYALEKPVHNLNAEGEETEFINWKATTDQFGAWLSRAGGFMEMPFPIQYPGDGMGSTPELTDDKRTDASKDYYSGKVYAVPVMSSFMRSGQEFADGDSVVHDYTNSYLSMYRKAVSYIDALQRLEKDKLPDGPKLDDKKRADLEKVVHDAPLEAQMEYDKITSDIEQRRFQGKHNIFRTGLMANKQQQSGTAIWSPDPSLDVDAMRINPQMAMTLGVKDGGWALIHRDPVLQGSGIRYMHCQYDETLAGISVNPAGVPGGMDGDFDGDTIGVRGLSGRAADAKKEAMAKLSVKANLLDRSVKSEATGRYALFIATGQDIAAGWAAKPELKDRYEQLEIQVNDFEQAGAEKKISPAQLDQKRRAAVKDISDYLRDCAEAGFGRHVISYASPEAHIESIQKFVDDGAKGSSKKVDTYARFAGISYERDGDGQLVPGSFKMADETLASRDEHIGILEAKNVQQQYTGFAGKFSIRGMKAAINIEPDTVCRLTKLMTQSVLQAKHDPEQATKIEMLLTGPMRDLWHGYKLQPCTYQAVMPKPEVVTLPDGTTETHMGTHVTSMPSWEPVKQDGKPVRATKAEFVQQFRDIMGSKDGMGLEWNHDLETRVAEMMSDGDYMMDLEGDFAAKYAAPMQVLAYDGTADTVRELAGKMMADPSFPGLFETHGNTPHNYNLAMADASVIRENLARKAYNETHAQDVDFERKPYKRIGKTDTLVDGKSQEKEALTTGKAVQTVRKVDRSCSDMPDIQPLAPDEDGKGYPGSD